MAHHAHFKPSPKTPAESGYPTLTAKPTTPHAGPSPTMNTKAALADVMAMFASPLPWEKDAGHEGASLHAAAGAHPVPHSGSLKASAQASLPPRPLVNHHKAAAVPPPAATGGFSVFVDEPTQSTSMASLMPKQQPNLQPQNKARAFGASLGSNSARSDENDPSFAPAQPPAALAPVASVPKSSFTVFVDEPTGTYAPPQLPKEQAFLQRGSEAGNPPPPSGVSKPGSFAVYADEPTAKVTYSTALRSLGIHEEAPTPSATLTFAATLGATGRIPRSAFGDFDTFDELDEPHPAPAFAALAGPAAPAPVVPATVAAPQAPLPSSLDGSSAAPLAGSHRLSETSFNLSPGTPALRSASRTAAAGGDSHAIDPFTQSVREQAARAIGVEDLEGFEESDDPVDLAALTRQGPGARLVFGLNDYRIRQWFGKDSASGKFTGCGDDCCASDPGQANVLLKLFAPQARIDGVYEFAMLAQAWTRVEEHERSFLMEPIRFHSLPSASVLVARMYETSSLHEIVSVHREQGKKLEEALVLYFAIELLRCTSALHRAGILHADIKPDNILLRDDSLDSEEDLEWPQWEADRPGAWAQKGLRFIDFGQSIDLRGPLEGARFCGDTHTESFRPLEMVQGREWCHQIDCYGVAATLHVLLHSEYMEVVVDDRTGRVRPREPFKRYWQAQMWEHVFDVLLNCGTDPHNPPDLDGLRAEIEHCLEINTVLSKKVKGCLARSTNTVYDKRNGH